jgi:hypothetical protein
VLSPVDLARVWSGGLRSKLGENTLLFVRFFVQPARFSLIAS